MLHRLIRLGYLRGEEVHNPKPVLSTLRGTGSGAEHTLSARAALRSFIRSVTFARMSDTSVHALRRSATPAVSNPAENENIPRRCRVGNRKLSCSNLFRHETQTGACIIYFSSHGSRRSENCLPTIISCLLL